MGKGERINGGSNPSSVMDAQRRKATLPWEGRTRGR